MKNTTIKILAIAAALFVSPAICCADVSLPDVIGDRMVLQRNQVVAIWGKAAPGEVVTVGFGGQTKKTTADNNGAWRVNLDRMPANATPATMTIMGRNTIKLQNILVGEVWLVSGQSNMQLTLPETNDGAAAIAAANHPTIRLFDVSRRVALKQESGPLGVWQVCSPDTIKGFSAAGYYFGVELKRALNVPIGLINSSFGGTQAEAWTPVEYLLASNDLRPTVERTRIWEAERPRVQAEYDVTLAKWREAVQKAKAEGTPTPRQPTVPDALRPQRIAASLYDGMVAPLIPFAIRGAVWYQG
ncbi:MAG: sialate O-acetylesterase, partial [Pyrinomonadaceae bacterium]